MGDGVSGRGRDLSRPSTDLLLQGNRGPPTLPSSHPPLGTTPSGAHTRPQLLSEAKLKILERETGCSFFRLRTLPEKSLGLFRSLISPLRAAVLLCSIKRHDDRGPKSQHRKADWLPAMPLHWPHPTELSAMVECPTLAEWSSH